MFHTDGDSLTPFVELTWCFSAMFGCCCLKILFCSWSQVLKDKVVTTRCHETVCLMIGIELTAGLLSLNCQCCHIRFTKVMMWCVTNAMLSGYFGLKVSGHTRVFGFSPGIAVVHCRTKAGGLLSQDIQAHHEVSMDCMWTTQCSRSRVCCSGITWCVISCSLSGGRGCDQKWSLSTVGKVEEVETRLKVDEEG